MMRSLCSVILLLLTGSSVSQRRGRLGAGVSQASEFDCPEEFGYYPHPSDCTQYYVCVFGGALLESCTGGLMYSHELQTCDWPRNVGCGLEGESATVSTIRVTDSRTRQGPATGQGPSRASVLSARVQSEQQKRQEDELAKHQLYAEDVGPAEEIESDRQQRVYRGQPSTLGQVARDRDGLRHQPVTNALPTSTGRVGSEDKIGIISFGIPQQAANTQYRVEPSSPPVVYNQQAQGQQQQLSPAQNQVAYNTSRQEYDQAQYDPYYNLYDEEDVELYRDVDYSQYTSNTGPASNVQYRGQNYKQVIVPQREPKSPSYAQPNYSNQDVYGQTISAQDYDKNYNTPADDQYQQNIAVQQPVKTPTRKVMRQRERGGSTQQTTQSVDSSHFDKLWTPALLSTQTPKPDRKQTQGPESRGVTNKNVHDYSTKPYTTEAAQTRRQTQSPKNLELQTQRSVKLDATKSPKDASHRSAPSYSTTNSALQNTQTSQTPARSRGVQPHYPPTAPSPTNFKPYEISGNIREQARKKDNSFSQGGNTNVNPSVRSNAADNFLFEPRTPSNYDVNLAKNSESNSNFPTSQRYVQTSLDIDDTRNTHVPASITERTLAKNIDRTTKLPTTSRQPLRQTTERLNNDVHSGTNTLVGHSLSRDRKEDIDSTSQSAAKGVETDPSSSLSRNSIIQTDSTTLRSRGRGHSQQRKQQTSSCSESFENNVNVDCKDKPQVRVRPVTALPDTQSTPGPTRGSSTTSRTRGSASYTTASASGGVETVNRGTPASVRSRPTLKPSTAIVSKAAEFIDIYKFPPSRPETVYPTPTPDKTAAKCRKDVCQLPDCNCGGKDIPGGYSPEEIPQIVVLTFDDSANDLNKGLYSDLFDKGRKNPNGCPISATFYVSHEWTDYSHVQNLYSTGHEIASHSISHSFGEKFSQKKWTKEIAGQREILSAYGGVRLEDIRGMRAPFLAVGGNKMFKMLYDSNFTYDSSMPVYENKPPSWPYTLDYKLFHDCMIPPCPTRSYPGVWEVPMVMWQDLNGGRCSMGDACSNPPTADGVYKMLIKNFERHYTTNRAPFGLFYHAAWFTQPHHKEGFIAFMDTIVAMQDVWLVTNWQAIQWVRDPTPLSRISSFQPFQCNYPERPKKCNNPKVCNLWHKSGVRYMRTCQPCPDIYPWTGKTGVRNSRVDNEIIEE